MVSPLKVIKALFDGIEASDSFSPPNKDYANMMKKSFESEAPYEFFQSLNQELMDLIALEDQDAVPEADAEAFIQDLGKIIMLYVKFRDKTPVPKSRPKFKPSKQSKNTKKK